MSGSFHHFYKIIYERLIISTSKNVSVKSNFLKYSVSLKYSRTFIFVRFYGILPFRISFDFSIFTTHLMAIDHFTHASLGFFQYRLFNFQLYPNVKAKSFHTKKNNTKELSFTRNEYAQTFESQWCRRLNTNLFVGLTLRKRHSKNQ